MLQLSYAPLCHSSIPDATSFGDVVVLSIAVVYYAKFRSRSHDAVIRVYDAASNVIETHEHKGEFRELGPDWLLPERIGRAFGSYLLRNRLRPRLIGRDDNVPCRCHEESLAVFFLICLTR